MKTFVLLVAFYSLLPTEVHARCFTRAFLRAWSYVSSLHGQKESTEPINKVLKADESIVEIPLKSLPPKILRNRNIEAATCTYPCTTWRTLDVVKFLFKEPFRLHKESLGKGARVLDIGGGYSAYGLALAREGFHVTVISAHDFYSTLHSLKSRSREHFLKKRQMSVEHQDRFVDKIGEVPAIAYLKLAATFNFPPPDYVQYLNNSVFVSNKNKRKFDDYLWTVSQEMFHKIEEERTSGRFDYQVGLAQDLLKTIPDGSVEMGFDIYGAYHYSSDRIGSIFS